MVEYTLRLDEIFESLADSTRRDILRRVARSELTVSEIAVNYGMSLAAVSKHIIVLEKAGLVVKRKRGKEHLVRMAPGAIREAAEYLGGCRNEELDILIKVVERG